MNYADILYCHFAPRNEADMQRPAVSDIPKKDNLFDCP